MLTEKPIDRYRRWLREGYKEVEWQGGRVEKVKITADDERLIHDLISFFENQTEPIDSVKAGDALCERTLQKPNSVEALQWLQQSGNGTRNITGAMGDFDQLSKDEAVKIVQDIYERGAIKVTVVDINGHYEQAADQYAATLIIELPEDPPLRKQVFKWINRLARRQSWETQADKGQKYLCIRWD
jgi:hypothetical protein